jgi:hypothetical protein
MKSLIGKNKMKVLGVFACAVFWFMSSVSVKDASAVIFAADTFYLYEDGKRIEDNTVIKQTKGGTILEVCEGGKFEEPQNALRDIILYKTKTDNLTRREWLNSPEGEGKTGTAYEEDYLAGRVKDAVFSKEIKLPETTDSRVYNPPKEGMTGGQLGKWRGIKIDIKTGEVYITK